MRLLYIPHKAESAYLRASWCLTLFAGSPLTQIAFKPPIIDQLAKEVGIDPAILAETPAIVAELASPIEYESSSGNRTIDSL